jgi:DNA polymerase V
MILKKEHFYSVDLSSRVLIPLFTTPLHAGFPSPAEDYLDLNIDLNRELIKNPSSTFFVRAAGDSMLKAGISPGDLLIIDRSLKPKSNDIAVCVLDGDFTLKYIQIRKDQIMLIAANEKYQPIIVTAENDFQIWGILIHSIKTFGNGRFSGL